MKRIAPIILTLIFFANYFALCAEDKENTLLWEISGKGLVKPSYLFGTIHVNDHRAFNFSDSLFYAIGHTDAYFMELHPDSMMHGMYEMLYNKGGRKLEEYFDDDELEIVRKCFKDINSNNIRMNDLWHFEFYLKQYKHFFKDKATFVDVHLYDVARRQGKMIGGLEKYIDQAKLMEKLDPEKQKQRILKLLQEDSTGRSFYEAQDRIVRYYAMENLDSIYSVSADTSIQTQEDIDLLLKYRNIKMAEKIDSLANEFTAVYAVGSAHLPGKFGLIELLRGKGFHIRPVKRVYTGLAETYNYDKVKLKWSTFKDPLNGYHIQIPGYPAKANLNGLGDINVYEDFGTGITYYFMAMPKHTFGTYFDNTEIGWMNKNYISFMALGNILLKNKDIKLDGIDGKLLTYWDGETYTKLLYIDNQETVYSIYITTLFWNKRHKDINRFFKSFKIDSLEKNDMKKFSPVEGGFEAVFPGEPVIINNYYTNLDNEEGYLDGKYYAKVDPEKNITFLIKRYDDFENSEYYNGDSLSLEESQKNIIEDESEKLLYSKHRIVCGCPAIKYAYKDHKNYIHYYLEILRGASRYNAVAVTPPDTDSIYASVFLNSFKLLEEDYSDFDTVTIEGLSFQYPSTMEFYPDWTQYDSTFNHKLYSEKYYQSIDKKNDISYILDITEYSDLFQCDSDSLFFSWRTNHPYASGMSLNNLKDMKINGFPGKSFTFESDSSHYVTKMTVLLKGRTAYTLTCKFPKKYDKWNIVAKPFETLCFTDKEVNGDIFSDKKDIFAEAAHSKDKKYFKQLRNAIENYEFKSGDLPLFYELALNKYYDDYKARESFRDQILNEIFYIADSTALNFIDSNFAEITYNDENDYLKTKALKPLLKLNSKESMDIFYSLIKRHPFTKTYQQYIRDMFDCDFHSYDQSLLFPELFELSKDSSFQAECYRLMADNADSSFVNKDSLDNLENDILDFLKEQYKIKNKKTSPQMFTENFGYPEFDIADYYNFIDANSYTDDNIKYAIKLLSYSMKETETVEYLNSLLDSLNEDDLFKKVYIPHKKKSDFAIARLTVEALLKGGHSVKDSLINQIARHKKQGPYFMQSLQSMNKDSLFPEEINNQRYFSDLEVENMFSGENGGSSLHKLTCIEEMPYENEYGIEEIIYVYEAEISSGWGDERVDKRAIAITGPYSKDSEKIVVFSKYSGYDYKNIEEDTDINDRIEKIISDSVYDYDAD